MLEARVRSHDPRSAWGIIAAAFVVRLLWGLAAGVTPGGAGFDDAAWYHRTAITLAHGGGYLSPFTAHPTAAWPPGYPLVLSLAYRVAGTTPATAVALNAIFGAFTCFFVWRLGAHLGGARLGLVAVALVAFFPSHVFFAAVVLSETLFTCLVCGLVLAAVRLLARAGDAPRGAWVVWGLAAGLTALVRAESVVVALVPAASLAIRADRRARRVLAATLLGVVVALAPWTLRNFRVFGTFVPTSTGFGRTLWIGHNPLASGGMSDAIQAAMQQAILAAGVVPDAAGEVAVDRLLRRQALAFALAHPARELVLTPLRTYHLFRGDHVWQSWYDPGTPRVLPSAEAHRLLGAAGNLYYAVVGVLAVAGLFLRRPEPAASWRILDVLIVVWIALFTAIYGDPRFHHVLIPFACILAAVAVLAAAGGRDTNELDATRAA
jgi:4-amino-4-deoxy-L-arabinose transferase-like glycosyltransferase